MQHLKNPWCVLQCSVGVPLPVRMNTRLWLIIFLTVARTEERMHVKSYVLRAIVERALNTKKSKGAQFQEGRDLPSEQSPEVTSFLCVCLALSLCTAEQTMTSAQQRGFTGRGDTMEAGICRSLNCRAGSPRLTTLSLGFLLIKALK